MQGVMTATQPCLEDAVFFGASDRKLFGILHKPTTGNRSTALLCLNAGLQYRVGPHRVYVKLARRLSADGFAVLRCDLPGIGDSPGPEPEKHFDLYRATDVISAIDYLQSLGSVSRIVLLGICAGARVAFKAAALDPRVDAVVAWSTPVLSGGLDMPESPESHAPSKKASMLLIARWLGKSLSPRVWRDYFSAGNTLKGAWQKLARVTSAWRGRRQRPATGQISFLEAIDSYLDSGRKACFAYGELDRLEDEEFKERFPQIVSASDKRQSYRLIPGGDHTFTSVESERLVINETEAWLKEWYPSS